jgi:choloylglycine hydrolase
LNSVAQGSATKWSIVYNITNRQVHFITHDYQDRKTFSFSDFNFSCADPSKAFDMNSKAKGNIAGLFIPLTSDRNRKLIEKSAEESKSQVKISKSSIDESVNLYKVQKCIE